MFNHQPLEEFGEGESLQMSPSPETCHVCTSKCTHEEMGRALEAMQFGFHMGICSIVTSLALRPSMGGVFFIVETKGGVHSEYSRRTSVVGQAITSKSGRLVVSARFNQFDAGD